MIKNKFQRIFSLLLVTLSLSITTPANADGVEKGVFDWMKQVKEIKLSNGLTFLIYPRGEVPIFSAYIQFRVGGMEEDPRQNGLAHFLEHMAFKGTSRIGTRNYEEEKKIIDALDEVGIQLAALQNDPEKNREEMQRLQKEMKSLQEKQSKLLVKEEVHRLMLEHGGTDLNAFTSMDTTAYHVTLPSEEIDFWAKLESERLFQPVFREFYQERDVVLEERRMRVDNDPDGRLYEALLGVAFTKSPYRFPTIGTQEAILRLTRKDLEAFYKKYYRPERMIGVLVGKLDPDKTKKLLEETFGKISFPPAEESLPTPDLKTIEPEQTTERRKTIVLPARPRFVVAYHQPMLDHPDNAVFDVLDQILTGGRSSRLYRKLVLDKKVAVSIQSYTGFPGMRLPSLFSLWVTPSPGHSTDEILALLEDELKHLQAHGPTAQELQKAKNNLEVDLYWHMKTNEGLASQMADYQIVAGDWRYPVHFRERVRSMQAADVQRVVAQYFGREKRSLVEIKGGARDE